MRALAAQFLELAEKQRATVPLMVGHRLMGSSLTLTGDIAEGRAHYDQAVALYDPAEHRSLETRFGQDVGVSNLAFRSLALWLLGYPVAAQMDNDEAVSRARQIGHGATLILAQVYTSLIGLLGRDYTAANTAINEFTALAEEKGAIFWRVTGKLARGNLLAQTHQSTDAVPMLSSGLVAWRSTGAKMFLPFWLACLSRAYAVLANLIWLGSPLKKH